jgi:hypothetical protein
MGFFRDMTTKGLALAYLSLMIIDFSPNAYMDHLIDILVEI